MDEYVVIIFRLREGTPRSEMAPLVWWLANTRGDGTLHSDSAYVVNGYREKVYLDTVRGRHFHNSDMWWDVASELMRRPGGRPVVAKVKAHLPMAPDLPAHGLFCRQGNWLADEEVKSVPSSTQGLMIPLLRR